MDASAPVTQPPAPGALTVRITPSGPLYWAAAAHRIPPLAEITVTNGTESVVRDLTVELSCEPGYLHSGSFALAPINPGAEAVIREPACSANLGRLKELIEAEVATLTVRLFWRGTEVASAREPLMVLAHNEWDRGIRRDLIAAFVMPNHPAIRELVSEASQVQQEQFGRTELDGYQSGSAERVKQQAASIYGATQKRGITYIGSPASFEGGSQKVRFPEALRQEKQGNCIEVATWYAAALEACGLRAVLVLLRGHAFAGFWLTNEASPLDPIETDASVVRGRAGAAGGLGSLVLVETTRATARPPISFAEACAAALAQVTDDGFQEMIDVSAARLLGVKPLNAVVDDAVAQAQGAPVARPDLTLPATTPLQREAGTGQRRLTSRFEAWIDTLVDLTLRNVLIGGTMADDPSAWGGLRPRRGVTLAVPDVAAFENDLADGVVFRVSGDAPASPSSTDHEATVAFRAFLAQQQERRIVVADPGGRAVPERIKTLWKKHCQSIEEKGISALHVAFGFLRWYESESSPQARYAPLLMVPAHLERISIGGDFTLRMADAEAVLNVALVQKLRRDFDIDLSGLAADLPEDDCGVDVAAIFAMVSDAVLRLRRFEVVPIATLGLFDYRKQVMAKDLQTIFASGHPSPNDFLARLEPRLGGERTDRFGDGGDDTAVFPDPHRLDELVRAGDLPLVVDCDSSQLSAVQAAVEGRSFLLQGPPGTGKSQTITNMIACLLAAGRRVLFVAEKRAALSVVANRLARAGLGSACLELHSEKADPGVVSATLVAALDGNRHAVGEDDFDRVAQRVEETRTRLNAFVQRLHAPTLLGLSFFRASARRHALRDVAAPPVAHDDLVETSRAQFEDRMRALESLEAAVRDCGGWSGHPLHAVRLATWTERREEAAAAALAGLAREAQGASAALDTAAAMVGIGSDVAHAAPSAVLPLLEILAQAPPSWVRELSGRSDRADYLTALNELGAVAARHAEARNALGERWTDGLFSLDVTAIAAQIRAAQGRWALARWLALRAPRATLRGVAKGRLAAIPSLLADLDLAIAARSDAATLDGASPAVAALMGPAFAGSRTPAETFARAEMAARWDAAIQRLAGPARAGDSSVGALAMPAVAAVQATSHAAAVADALAKVRAAADLAAGVLVLDRVEAFGAEDPVSRLRETAAFAIAAAAALPRLRDKTASEAAVAEAEQIGLAAFVGDLRAGRVGESGIALAYEAGFLKAWVAEMTEVHPVLGQFRGREHDRVVEAFRRADRELFAAGRERARRQVLQRRPAPAAAVHAQSEVGILRREAARRRRRMPVRRLLAELPTLVPRLTPCMLMSPLAVAHFLPVDCEKFDAVIFDEASQVRTADAVGALWRGRQVIVVGDPQQMPPTDFFTSDGGEDVEADGVLQDAESILSEAFVSGVPRHMLAWHYRSRDERLIAFSNRNYYGNELVTFPAADPDAGGCGLEFVRVPGLFDRGASRRNEIEARRVVDLIVDRLCDLQRRERSIGVVTFNIQQQDLIETLLEEKRLAHPEIEPYFSAAAPEPVFVKNLENVQGDERDVMIFSTTFGRDATGRITLNFGPMNRQGGERRLNVAVTRARERLTIVSSMDPEEIDLSRTGSLGVRHLRDFLAYARDGLRALRASVSVDPLADCESPFEEDVLSVCESLGWRVDRQVGCSGYRIDLAVRDPDLPGRHVMGIECDGATYHSAATARDRDRLRQAVLENLGWKLHRIWSTDWRLARDAEIARLRQVHDAAVAQPRRPAGHGANGELKPPEVVTEAATLAPTSAAPALGRVEAAPPLRTIGEPIDPALVTHEMRRDAIVAVLHSSGAMPLDALIRAAAIHVGHQRVGSRIRSAFEVAIRHMFEDGAIRMLDDRIALSS